MHLGRRQRFTTVGVAAVATALSLAACSSSGTSSAPSGGSTSSAPAGGSTSSGAALSGTLNGSGSTFQLTFQQTAISSFKSVQSGMTVNYGGGGSGKGRTDLASGTVNYAGSDSTIPAAEQANFKGKTVLYFPVIVGPITLSYNLSGLSKPLQLSAPVIAGIFQGKITKWNDSAIAADNPGVTLPSTAIAIAVRSDSSGTTANFTNFLVQAAGSAWTLGTSSIIKWPATAHAGSGNGGVAQVIKSTPGAIGYVDYSTAKASSLSRALGGVGLRGRQPGHPQARRHVQRDLGARCDLLPDHLSVVRAGLPDPAERERRGDAQGVHRLPARRRPETAAPAELRAVAV